MARRTLECYGCGEPVPNLFVALSHCDPNVPIDDIDEDDRTEYRSVN